MQTTVVITVLGADRPGLVQTISEALVEHQGSWKDSRMVRLAGKFAGLLQVTVPTDKHQSLLGVLNGLHVEDNELSILAEVDQQAEPGEAVDTLQLEVLGPDAPGIIHNITTQLATIRVNIEELSSEQRAAPMSNETLFFAAITLGLPPGVSADDVQDTLEGLSDQLMVDINFS